MICWYVTEWANFGCKAVNICTMGPNLNLLEIFTSCSWMNQPQGNMKFFHWIQNPCWWRHNKVKKEMLCLTCRKTSLRLSSNLSQSSSKPSSFGTKMFSIKLPRPTFGTKMFSIKLPRPTFTDEVYTCFGPLVGILKAPKNGQETATI